MNYKKDRRKIVNTEPRISHGKCPLCEKVAKLLASRVFSVEVCLTCLSELAKGDGWL